MYCVKVYYPGDRCARVEMIASNAQDIREKVEALLAHHGSCERIVVTIGQAVLYTVDCTGLPLLFEA